MGGPDAEDTIGACPNPEMPYETQPASVDQRRSKFPPCPAPQAAAAAKKELDALFGESTSTNSSRNDPDDAKSQLDALFGLNKEDKDS